MELLACMGVVVLFAAGGACGSELRGHTGGVDALEASAEGTTGEVSVESEVEVEVESEFETETETETETEVESEVEVEFEFEFEVEFEVEVESEVEFEVEVEVESEVEFEFEVEVESEIESEITSDPCAALADGTPCDDHNACTTGDRCLLGACRALAPLVCDDANPCTDDTCLPAAGCAHLPNLAGCDDGDVCTRDDRCLGGQCTSGAKRCVDDNPCTRDLCDPTHPASPCSYVDQDGAPCEDASACTGDDVCAGGVCMAGLADGCASTSVCLLGVCADDGLRCIETPLTGTLCDDGNACTQEDQCQAGYCTSGAPVDCGWNASCAKFHCDAVQGCVLEETYAAGKSCSDADDCTIGEVCDAFGACIPAALKDCDDHSDCTSDTCDPDWGCRHTTLYGGPCDDGNACSTSDTCSYYGCRGTARTCNDHDACTLDSCDPLLGCQAVRVSCDDGNDCTTDGCEPATGCTHEPVAVGACDDHRGCTSGDHCEAGVCVATSTCDDGDPCTTDWCDAETGCGASRLCPLGNGCNVSAACVAPLGALAIASVTDDVDGPIIGVRNISAATFDLVGFGIGSASCGCTGRIREHVLIAPGETLYARPIADAAGDEDLVFGAPGEVFAITFASDEVRLEGPLGAIPGGTIDTFGVGAD